MDNFKMFGLIGKKLGHSYSADFFNKKFKEETINAEYRLFPLENISLFPLLIKEYPELRGLNVTVPYKQEVMGYLSGLSKEAEEIGAVNVVKINPTNNTLIGYNSDVYGFEKSLRPFLNPHITSALVLGTGGASKAVVYVLKKLGIKVTLVSRDKSKGDLTYDQLTKEILSGNLLIVNTTPLGMYPDVSSYPPIPYEYITPDHVCYDLVYNPEKTEFLRRCEENGAKIKNGLEMLRLQAERSWEIWCE